MDTVVNLFLMPHHFTNRLMHLSSLIRDISIYRRWLPTTGLCGENVRPREWGAVQWICVFWILSGLTHDLIVAMVTCTLLSQENAQSHMNHLHHTPSPEGSVITVEENGERAEESEETRKQCLLEKAGQMHIWTHRGSESTCTGPVWAQAGQNPRMLRGGGHKSVPLSQELWKIIGF